MGCCCVCVLGGGRGGNPGRAVAGACADEFVSRGGGVVCPRAVLLSDFMLVEEGFLAGRDGFAAAAAAVWSRRLGGRGGSFEASYTGAFTLLVGSALRRSNEVLVRVEGSERDDLVEMDDATES